MREYHGLTHTPEYSAYHHMIQRCYNPKDIEYKNYGGRGIRVCARWQLSVVNFYTDMGARPGPEYSLERIDNEGNYEPDNCKWATKSEQSNNRRPCATIKIGDETITTAELARRAGLPQNCLRERLRRGWTLQRALSTPVQHKS